MKYMILLHGDKPEIVEADSFTTEGAVLIFWTQERKTAAFYSWVGLKEITGKDKDNRDKPPIPR